VGVHVHQVPVVEPRAAYRVFVDAKAEPPHQVQRRLRRDAQAPDVARVRWDLRLDQDDVKRPLGAPGSQALYAHVIDSVYG
jgi:hypothetical protein